MKVPRLAVTDKHYKADGPCKKGHPPFRYKSTRTCIYCDWVKVHKWRDSNPGHTTARNKAYYRNNLDSEIARRNKRAKDFPEERLALNRNRRARLRAAPGRHTRHDVLELFNKQKGRCVGLRCRKLLKQGYHVDHIIPLSRGGSNWPSNLQLLCASCNDSKGVMTMEEWSGQKELLDNVRKACFKLSYYKPLGHRRRK